MEEENADLEKDVLNIKNRKVADKREILEKLIISDDLKSTILKMLNNNYAEAVKFLLNLPDYLFTPDAMRIISTFGRDITDRSIKFVEGVIPLKEDGSSPDLSKCVGVPTKTLCLMAFGISEKEKDRYTIIPRSSLRSMKRYNALNNDSEEDQGDLVIQHQLPTKNIQKDCKDPNFYANYMKITDITNSSVALSGKISISDGGHGYAYNSITSQPFNTFRDIKGVKDFHIRNIDIHKQLINQWVKIGLPLKLNKNLNMFVPDPPSVAQLSSLDKKSPYSNSDKLKYKKIIENNLYDISFIIAGEEAIRKNGFAVTPNSGWHMSNPTYNIDGKVAPEMVKGIKILTKWLKKKILDSSYGAKSIETILSLGITLGPKNPGYYLFSPTVLLNDSILLDEAQISMISDDPGIAEIVVKNAQAKIQMIKECADIFVGLDTSKPGAYEKLVARVVSRASGKFKNYPFSIVCSNRVKPGTKNGSPVLQYAGRSALKSLRSDWVDQRRIFIASLIKLVIDGPFAPIMRSCSNLIGGCSVTPEKAGTIMKDIYDQGMSQTGTDGVTFDICFFIRAFEMWVTEMKDIFGNRGDFFHDCIMGSHCCDLIIANPDNMGHDDSAIVIHNIITPTDINHTALYGLGSGEWFTNEKAAILMRITHITSLVIRGTSEAEIFQMLDSGWNVNTTEFLNNGDDGKLMAKNIDILSDKAYHLNLAAEMTPQLRLGFLPSDTFLRTHSNGARNFFRSGHCAIFQNEKKVNSEDIIKISLIGKMENLVGLRIDDPYGFGHKIDHRSEFVVSMISQQCEWLLYTLPKMYKPVPEGIAFLDASYRALKTSGKEFQKHFDVARGIRSLVELSISKKMMGPNPLDNGTNLRFFLELTDDRFGTTGLSMINALGNVLKDNLRKLDKGQHDLLLFAYKIMKISSTTHFQSDVTPKHLSDLFHKWDEKYLLNANDIDTT